MAHMGNYVLFASVPEEAQAVGNSFDFLCMVCYLIPATY